MTFRAFLDAAHALLVEAWVTRGRTLMDAIDTVEQVWSTAEAEAAAAQGDRSLLARENARAMEQLMAMMGGTAVEASP